MKTGGVTGQQRGREGTTNQPHNHTTQPFSSTRHVSDRISEDNRSRIGRPHSGPSNRAKKKTGRTKGQNTRGPRGEQEKADGRSRSQQARRHHRDTTQTRPDHCFVERNSGGTQQTYSGYKGTTSCGKRGDGGGQETTRMEEHECTSRGQIGSTWCK